MAAKVLVVAVPTTLLGLASIRVYGVSEAKRDGLFSPRQLCVYDPIPQSQHYQFIADQPGVMERGLGSVRESLLPYVKAVQVKLIPLGACVSVKVGTVNLYHAGEDVYHFLCAPPPGFLPRVGTITMAGLVGMLLARKGSPFKRVAVPLSLMTTGATVCYPAQAVVLLKVSGNKLYSAAQWSSASVSSLLTSSPKDPGASPPPQAQILWRLRSPQQRLSQGKRL
ncbi:MICOS complex subunit MIC27 [Aplochiton taeniatus]